MKSQLGEMWLAAGADLGFKVTAPFTLTTNGGVSFSFDAIVHDFGSNHGMLLMEQWNAEKAKAATDHGFGYSCISAGAYERDSTIEVLQDWGWSGSGIAPPWL